MIAKRCREKEKRTVVVGSWPAGRRLPPDESFAETYVEKTIALIFRAWTETGDKHGAVHCMSTILFGIYRLAISSIRSNIVARLF